MTPVPKAKQPAMIVVLKPECHSVLLLKNGDEDVEHCLRGVSCLFVGHLVFRKLNVLNFFGRVLGACSNNLAWRKTTRLMVLFMTYYCNLHVPLGAIYLQESEPKS